MYSLDLRLDSGHENSAHSEYLLGLGPPFRIESTLEVGAFDTPLVTTMYYSSVILNPVKQYDITIRSSHTLGTNTNFAPKCPNSSNHGP